MASAAGSKGAFVGNDSDIERLKKVRHKRGYNSQFGFDEMDFKLKKIETETETETEK